MAKKSTPKQEDPTNSAIKDFSEETTTGEAAEKAAAEKAAAEKAAAEKAAAEKAAAEKAAAEKAAAEKAAAENKRTPQVGAFLPDEKEENLFHVKLEKKSFNPSTGEQLSKPFIQKFTDAEWRHFKSASKGLGYSVEVMWDPTKK